MQHLRPQLERLDEKLAALARGEAGLRLRLGQALEVLSRGGVFELGFSSAGAYAMERCERGARWAEVARRVARQVESLPALRQRIATGEISWSMGELLARVARPEDETCWLERAKGRTVRQMRALVADAGVQGKRQLAEDPELPGELIESCGASREICTLECTVAREDAWLFEATRLLLEHLGACGADGMDALLAEAHGTLLARLPKGAVELDQMLASDAARQRWLLQVAVWRDEAEAICEKRNAGWQHAQSRSHGELDMPLGAVAVAAALGMAAIEDCRCDELDAMVRALAQGLARHELDFARLLVTFHRANGWRWLGYASETQYARERLGLSRSAVLARRALAVRLEKLPGIAAALGRGEIGIEAAITLVRVATPCTEVTWIARARRRTIKHLREEVAAAQVAICCSGDIDCAPPLDSELEAFHDLERAVVGGGIRSFVSEAEGGSEPAATAASEPDSASESRRPWRVMLRSLASWLCGAPIDEGVQASAPRSGPGAGRVTLRLRFSRDGAAWWRRLAELAVPYLPPGMSWLRFACLSLWRAWQHELEHDVAYGHIYVRDRFRCMSPVCNRRDVTPHHLQFRSAGGSDDDENVGSLCTWCHLLGVHGGRIRACGSAGHIRWELGPVRSPCIVVEGRDRLVA